jgi:hypothetical protein
LLSEKARVLLFGVHKDAATLAQVLDPATFAVSGYRPLGESSER